MPKAAYHVPWIAVMLPALKAKLMTDGIRHMSSYVYRIRHMSSYELVNTVQCMEHCIQVHAMPPRMSSVLNGRLFAFH